MAVIFKWLVVIMAVMITANGIEGSCLTFSRLSCTQGSERGLGTDFNSPETRLIPAMELNCTGTLVGWTVSGRIASGTMYPKLQIWRRCSTDANLYFKNGPEIQIDAHGSACETITQNTVNCSPEFHCRLSAANQVSIHSGLDIIGVELPVLHDQGFELFFIGPLSARVSNRQYVWRREISTLKISTSSRDLLVYDHLLLSVDVYPTNVDIMVDECLANTADGCDQLCTNTIGSFRCSCIDGYTLSSDGRSCLDIDECTAGTHNCQQLCININGGFLCNCDSGYQLNSDGRNCSDINECNSNTTNWCNQLCINIDGSFQCSCTDGYTLSSNGRSCLDIDECAAGTHNCQQLCINTNGEYSCDCSSGYQLNSDGITCSDINECADNNEICHHICSNTDGSFRCSCRNGYTLDINQYTCTVIKVNGEQSCMITGAVVGGAISTPLLFTILFLVVALIYTIKRNQRKTSNFWDPATPSTQMTDNMAESSSAVIREIYPPPNTIYDNENIYSTIQDEDKITMASANIDEYIEMKPTVT